MSIFNIRCNKRQIIKIIECNRKNIGKNYKGKGYIKTEILDSVDEFTFNPISAKYGCNFKYRILPVMKITTAVISHQCLIRLIYASPRELSL